MLNIGIISSSIGTIEQIIEIAKSMLNPQNYQFFSFPYEEPCEIKDILQQHSGEIDGWIFSGPNPYTAAKPYLGKNDNTTFCYVTGNEIYKYLLELIYRLDNKQLRVSIDCPNSDVFAYSESVEQLEIPKTEIYFQEYTIPYDFNKIIEKHLSLWQAGKVDMVFTTLHVVHMAMQKKNVPVERIRVSLTSIRQAINMLEQKLTGIYFKNSQLGMEIIEIKDYDKFVEQSGNYYKMQKVEMEIKQILLDLCQSINGYLSEKGNGHYQIFASRGLIENHMKLLQDIIEKMKITSQIDLIAGVGFASTVFEAQLNAYKAIMHGRSTNSDVVILDEDGNFIQDLGTMQEMSYAASTNEPKLAEKLKLANVGINSYNRIAFIVRKMNWTTFTATQVAQQLNVTDRNIQRILSGLSKSGLVREVGQEALNKRGRPTRKYQLK